jgi:dihydropteroate synthase
LLSINTWRPAVAAAAVAAGADILNDMGGLPTDENARLCATHGAALLIMHTRGEPKVPHLASTYADVVADVVKFFQTKIEQAAAAGLPRDHLILDPGIDFAKQRADNLAIYRHLDRLTALGRPVLLPVSRKTVIGEVLDRPDPLDRDPGTAACIVAGYLRGAAIFRVHNVRTARQVLDTLEAVGHPH